MPVSQAKIKTKKPKLQRKIYLSAIVVLGVFLSTSLTMGRTINLTLDDAYSLEIWELIQQINDKR